MEIEIETGKNFGVYLCEDCVHEYVIEALPQLQPRPASDGLISRCRDCQRTEPIFVKITGPDRFAWINFWPV